MEPVVSGLLAILFCCIAGRLMWSIAYREGYRQGEAYGRGKGAEYVRKQIMRDDETRARHGGL